jgi:RimJ/RimL family protein N-acetyltransferase
MDGLTLREVRDTDLDLFFDWGRHPEAVRMAAFTSADPGDRAAFDEHWARILARPDVVNRTIILAGLPVGSIASFLFDGDLEITYWIDPAEWGRGIASAALELFLVEQDARPLHARAASDNAASIRVLEHNGFREIGRDTGFAEGRGHEVEEAIFILDGAPT